MASKTINKTMTVKELLKDSYCKMTLTITGVKKAKLRLKVFALLLKLICKILPIKVEIEWINSEE